MDKDCEKTPECRTVKHLGIIKVSYPHNVNI